MSSYRRADGHLYGTTTEGGPNADTTFPVGTGTVFRISLPDETFSMLHAFAPFDAVNGWYPEGAKPYGGLTLGDDGALYGTTNAGGADPGGLSCSFAGGGTIFKITTAGALTVLHALVGVTDGCAPNAGLSRGPDGNLYGTTTYGGGFGSTGTVFKITPAGSFTKLFSFDQDPACHCYAYGTYPEAEPIVDADGTLYGTAVGGGGPEGTGSGTIWKLTSSDEFTVLKAFTGAGSGADGSFPTAGLTFGSDGYLYGTTSSGGVNSIGTIFRITPAGNHEVLHSSSVATGGVPDGRLLEVSRHVFIGTAQIGGDVGGGVVFRLSLPVVDITANDEDGPIALSAGQELRLSIAFDAFAAGLVNPGRLYIGVVAPFGVYWITNSGFTTTPGALYTGPLPTFAPATLLTIPNAAALPSGTYYWFILVDTDGTGDTFDYAQVTVQP